MICFKMNLPMEEIQKYTGVSVEEIQKYTGVSVEEIEAFRKEME